MCCASCSFFFFPKCARVCGSLFVFVSFYGFLSPGRSLDVTKDTVRGEPGSVGGGGGGVIDKAANIAEAEVAAAAREEEKEEEAEEEDDEEEEEDEEDEEEEDDEEEGEEREAGRQEEGEDGREEVGEEVREGEGEGEEGEEAREEGGGGARGETERLSLRPLAILHSRICCLSSLLSFSCDSSSGWRLKGSVPSFSKCRVMVARSKVIPELGRITGSFIKVSKMGSKKAGGISPRASTSLCSSCSTSCSPLMKACNRASCSGSLIFFSCSNNAPRIMSSRS